MSEIEKLYENANADKDCKLYPNYIACPEKTKECTYCEYYVYPEFTAEKQLSLIKWLIANGHCYFTVSIEPREFTEYLARYVNEVWQDLTEEEKAEVKEILK